MSLGPPFDDSGERLRLGLGAAATAVLLFVTFAAVLLSDRPLGSSVTVHLMVRRPGALHTGAVVRLAGEQIGEVLAIRPTRRDQVDIEVRIKESYRAWVAKNSTFVPVNPTLLTEAVLEVGPPADGAAPGPPIADGDQLTGVDPADLDSLLSTIYVSTELILAQARELGPEWQELVASFGTLGHSLEDTVDSAARLRIAVQGARTLLSGRHLVRTLDKAGVVGLPAELALLDKKGAPLLDELTRLAAATELLATRAEELRSTFAPRRPELERAQAAFEKSVELGKLTERDARALVDGYLAGRGTLGAFYRDVLIFDELKETHRILKRESWRLFIKKKDPGRRNLR